MPAVRAAPQLAANARGAAPFAAHAQDAPRPPHAHGTSAEHGGGVGVGGDGADPPALHPGLQRSAQYSERTPTYWLFQPFYSPSDLDVEVTHVAPTTVRDHLALWSVSIARAGFDFVTGYGPNMTEEKWLKRFVFLETVAGTPGMVAAMLRHLRSLRLMKRDNGWIHTLLEEAENERMHLLTFLEMKQPGTLFRLAVLGAQGVFANFFFLTYLISPSLCHRFVGYLEEEAVKTYTHALADLDAGRLPAWERMPAPDIAVRYWQLPEDAVIRDVLLAVRADEACHRHVNHTLGSLNIDDKNPFIRQKS